jgi:hypothetical protein
MLLQRDTLRGVAPEQDMLPRREATQSRITGIIVYGELILCYLSMQAVHRRMSDPRDRPTAGMLGRVDEFRAKMVTNAYCNLY